MRDISIAYQYSTPLTKREQRELTRQWRVWQSAYDRRKSALMRMPKGILRQIVLRRMSMRAKFFDLVDIQEANETFLGYLRELDLINSHRVYRLFILYLEFDVNENLRDEYDDAVAEFWENDDGVFVSQIEASDPEEYVRQAARYGADQLIRFRESRNKRRRMKRKTHCI